MKSRICLILSIIMVVLITSTAFADAPYGSYTYDYWGDPVPAPAPYVPTRLIDGESLGIGPLRGANDLFVSDSNTIYIADSDNNRIIVLNDNWEVERVIEGFEKDGEEETFNKPQGLFVTSEEVLFVADTDNARIVELSPDGEFVREIGPPKADIIPANFEYKPMSLVVDRAKRLYVIAQGVNQGILEFDSEGTFRTYMGAPMVSANILQYVIRLFYTDEQLSRTIDFVPTEYNNISMDSDGFIYATTSSISVYDIQGAISARADDDRVAPVRKLNATGTDILRRRGYFPPVGDVHFHSRGYFDGGQSMFNDVCVDDYGIYSVLDNRKGRIFTYDGDSNILFIFGGKGNRLGQFNNPAALSKINENFIVLDKTGSGQGQITMFEPTDYGRMVIQAVSHHNEGRYEESTAAWDEVLKFNANSELAYIGMGKAYLDQDEFYTAMQYFRLGNKRDYYSKAFQLYRKDVIAQYFGFIVGTLFVVFIALYVRAKLKRRREVEA
ncbi:MAG TPA: NHL repeat-containing protein [Bacillota bacterium]|nr:NHL repeat-containing protein [Bacillota bacterium]